MIELPEKIIDTEYGQIKVCQGPGENNYIAKNANADGLKVRGQVYNVFGHFGLENGIFTALKSSGGYNNQVYVHKMGQFETIQDNKTAVILITLACCNALKSAYADPDFHRESNRVHAFNRVLELAEEYNRQSNQLYELQQKCQDAYSKYDEERQAYDEIFEADFVGELTK